MGKFIRLRKGFNINLAGKVSSNVSSPELADTFSVKPTDFQGLYMPRPVVKEGDSVRAGSPLFSDKRHQQIVFASPVSGEVVEIVRGEKRRLMEIKVLADRKMEFETFRRYSVSEVANLSAGDIRDAILKGGVWPQFIQRPFGIVADPSLTPKAIHISAFDSHPLAPDFGVLFKGQDHFFQVGIDALKKLTSGVVNVNVHSKNEISTVFSQVKGAELNKFAGPHPSGCVGVQIHHLDPISKGDVVWTISPFGVIQIGKLLLNGVHDSSRTVALVGPKVKEPQYYKVYTGSSVRKILKDNLKDQHVRVVSGNALTGTSIGQEGHIGYFDHQVTVLEEGDHHEFLGWIAPTVNRLSYHRAFGLLSFMAPRREFELNTNTNGEPRAFVQTGVFEDVLPMDILPTYLIKSILAEDIDEMEALGIYEVIEEDLALCEFVDVSKHNVQEILREGIELIQNS